MNVWSWWVKMAKKALSYLKRRRTLGVDKIFLIAVFCLCHSHNLLLPVLRRKSAVVRNHWRLRRRYKPLGWRGRRRRSWIQQVRLLFLFFLLSFFLLFVFLLFSNISFSLPEPLTRWTGQEKWQDQCRWQRAHGKIFLVVVFFLPCHHDGNVCLFCFSVFPLSSFLLLVLLLLWSFLYISMRLDLLKLQVIERNNSSDMDVTGRTVRSLWLLFFILPFSPP